MNPAYPSSYPHQSQHGQGINPSSLLGQAGGINPAQIMAGGGGMGGMNLSMMGGGRMNPAQFLQARAMMNGGLMGGNMVAMENHAMGGMGNNGTGNPMNNSMGGGMGGGMTMGGLGGAMGGGIGGNMMGGGGMSGMGGGMGGGMGSGMSNPMGNGAGMGGGMNTPMMGMNNLNDGMNMQRPGTSMSGVTATSLGGSFGNQFGDGNPSTFGGGSGGQPPPQQMPSQQHGQGMSQQQQGFLFALQAVGISREQYQSLNPHDRQIANERISLKMKERARMMHEQQQQQMMNGMSGGGNVQTPQQPGQHFSGNFPSERPTSSSSHPSMMPPPLPSVRPGTSMSMRRAPSMEHMRPPSAMAFPKPEQSPTGNMYPQPSPVSSGRIPGSPRMDNFAPLAVNIVSSPARPMSSASNGPGGFTKAGTPVRMPSVSRAATATPTSMNMPSSPIPAAHHPHTQPMRSTPTPAPPSVRESTPAVRAPTPARVHTPVSSTPAASAPPPSTAPTSQGPIVHKLPPLPPDLNRATTEITRVPLKDSLKLIPDICEEDKAQVRDWMKLDKEYEKVYLQMRERMEKERQAMGKRWWERGGGVPVGLHTSFPPPRERPRFDVKYPFMRQRKDNNRRPKVERREGLKLPRKLDPRHTNVPEELVPIRLEFDVDQHQKMRDTFVWNLNDPVVTPESFAQSVVEDYKMSSSYHSVIVKAIQDQLSDYKAHSTNYDGEGSEFVRDVHTDTVQTGHLEKESALWWKKWRKRVRTDFTDTDDQNAKRRRVASEDRPMEVGDFKTDEKDLHDDMRILVKLDIIVGPMKLEDQFEWDLDNAYASPESFAEVYAQDLGLNGEFKTAIAHAIREQVQTYQKSLFLVGHPSDGTPIQDEELRAAFLPSLSSAARPIDQVSLFTPLLNSLSDGELERHEKERDKDMNKRKKRNTRGRRGVALPDREAIKTYRTPAYGFPELDPAIQAQQAAANAPTSRRAAAAAASLTIANMVASENGGPILTSLPTVAQPQAPPPPKEKKQKWLLKAPEFPKAVLLERSRIPAPTRSTAADESTRDYSKLGLSAKKVKELERENKEREFAEGQHENYISGVWHCSNCGCPESIAVGRRKGPLGDKSQCGTCGIFWHRHRRPRPVEYNTNPEYHLRRDTETPTRSRKKGGAATLRAQAASTPRSEPQSPRIKEDDDYEMPPSRTDNALSPVSTASSMSEPPLSHRKTNGTYPPTLNAQSPSPPSKHRSPSPSAGQSDPPKSPSSQRSWPPQWLASAMQAVQVRYPNDKFEVALRKVAQSAEPKWRIKCLDCPGKLYQPGPGETLTNFEVHLRFNGHRKAVTRRVESAS